MKVSRIPAEHLVALYDHYKDRRAAYRKEAYQILGDKCSLCGSTESLRHRFNNPCDPRASQYRTNPVTLFRRICLELKLRKELYLICRECRIAHGGATSSNSGDLTPVQNPLDNPSTEGELNG